MGLDPKIAAYRVAEGFQNFNRVGKIWDLYSKTPFIGAPFAKFQGDVIRIMKQSATTRPLNFAATLASLYALSSIFSNQSGESDEDRRVREGRKNAPILPTPFGNISFEWAIGKQRVNVARFIMPAYAYASEYDDDSKQILEKWVPFYSRFKPDEKGGTIDWNKILSRDIMFAPIVNMAYNEDFLGNPIFDPRQDEYHKMSWLDKGTKALKGTRFAARGYIPYFDLADDIYTTATTGEDRYGRKKSPVMAVARYLGWNSQVFDNEKYQKVAERGLQPYMKRIELTIKEQRSIKKLYEEGDRYGKKISFESYNEQNANIIKYQAKAIEDAIKKMNENIGRLPKDVVSGIIDEGYDYKDDIKTMLKLMDKTVSSGGRRSGNTTRRSSPTLRRSNVNSRRH
jgi:hypothetical protein